MSVDIASLVFEIDATQADQAEKSLDRLTKASERAESAAKRIKDETAKATASYTRSSEAYDKAAQGASAYSAAQAQIAKATAGANEMARLEETLISRNAKLRGDQALQAVKAAEAQASAAQRLADKESAAWARVEAAIDKRNAKLRGDLAADAMREEAAAAGALEARMDRLLNSIDPTRAAQARLNAEMQEATSLYRMGAISASDYAKATSILDAKMAEAARSQNLVNGSFGGAGKGAKLAAHEVANLGAQFADVGVSLASGQALWLVAIQQGAQIQGVFGQAAGRGVTFASALKGIGEAARPAVALLGPLALVAGTAAAAFGLLNRELEKGYPQDITDGLGLTAEQLERVEVRTVTMGDTWAATLDVMAKYLTQGPLGEALDAFDTRWNSFLDDLGANTANEVANIVGFFLGAYRSITNLWSAFPAAFGDIAAMAVNMAIGAVELWVNANVKAFNTILEVGSALSGKMLPRIPELDLSGYKQQVTGAASFVKQAIGANISQSIADVKRGMGQIGKEIRDGALASARAVALKAAGDPNKGTQASRAASDAARDAERELERLTKAAEAYVAQLEKQNAAVGRSAVQLKEMEIAAAGAAAPTLALKLAITEQGDYAIGFLKAAEAIKEINKNLVDTPAYLQEMAAKMDTAEDRARDLADAFADVTYSVRDMVRSLKSGDIGGFIQNIQGAISGITTLLSQGPAGILSLGSMAANAIGGKSGRAIGSGLGLAASGVGLGAFAGTTAGAAALGTVGLGAGAIGSIAALAGPIGIAAGALYAAAKLLNVGGKKSNAGAGYDLTTGAFSGKSRTEETEQAVKAAGDGIRQAQELLKASGVTLGATVNGLVIGTRDLSQIYLSNGKTLTSAVGDSAAAIDAALKGILDGATYQSDAQKKLVESALAAGKGLDDLAAILGAYEQAQAITGDLADQILKLTDPKAYDIKAVEREIKAQADAAKAAADAGYITADQLATINGQLATLKGLRLDEVLNGAVNDNRIEDARDNLTRAYEREADALRTTIDRFKSLSDSLKKFKDSLYTGPAAMLSPEEQYRATRAKFDQTAALARGGDEAAMAELQNVSQAYLDASKDYYASSKEYFADLEAVRAAVSATEAYASNQVSAAEQQLAALDKSVEGLITINESVLSVRDAIAALQGAISAASAPTVETPTAANQNSPAPFVAATTQVVTVADPQTAEAIESLTATVEKLTQAQIDQQAAMAAQQEQQAQQAQQATVETHRYLRKTQAF